jgi:hypothetical protein
MANPKLKVPDQQLLASNLLSSLPSNMGDRCEVTKLFQTLDDQKMGVFRTIADRRAFSSMVPEDSSTVNLTTFTNNVAQRIVYVTGLYNRAVDLGQGTREEFMNTPLLMRTAERYMLAVTLRDIDPATRGKSWILYIDDYQPAGMINYERFEKPDERSVFFV